MHVHKGPSVAEPLLLRLFPWVVRLVQLHISDQIFNHDLCMLYRLLVTELDIINMNLPKQSATIGVMALGAW